MKKIKEWVAPGGIVILVILASMIKMDTSHMGKSHSRCVTKQHVQRGELGLRGQFGPRSGGWRKARGERLGRANRNKESQGRESSGKPSWKK